MNTQNPPTEPTIAQIKAARALGYSIIVRRGLTQSAVDGVKTAAENLNTRAGQLVANYKERLTKRASRLESVYSAIVEPTPA